MYGAFVRQVRRSRGMSQAELASISGIAQSNVSAIENDRRMPSAETLNRLLVSCGYELTATAGDVAIHCEIPDGDWYPGGKLPPPSPDDPPDETPTVTVDASISERTAAIRAVLEIVDATAGGRR